jgi:hypothetical protein
MCSTPNGDIFRYETPKADRKTEAVLICRIDFVAPQYRESNKDRNVNQDTASIYDNADSKMS